MPLTPANFLPHLLGPVFDVRPEERKKTLLMFLYFFLIIGVIYILKPVRSSLFLSELGASKLRYVYIGEGAFLAVIVAIYVHLAKSLHKRTLNAVVLGFFAFNLILFWTLFQAKAPYLSAFFYVWVASFSITMTTQFWTLANDIFNPIEAKRLFGLIATGGSFGGVFGGLSASYAVNWVQTEDLLLLASMIITACIVISSYLFSFAQNHEIEKKSSPEFSQPPSLKKIFSCSSYLIYLALLVVFTKMASTIVDNQFMGAVELSVSGKEERTAFFGGFMAWINVAAFFLQLIATSFSLRFWGVGISLLFMPLGVGLLSAGTLIYPGLFLSKFLKLYDGSVSYSIQLASKEILFLPLSSSLRYRVKPMIDMLGFRMAKSLGGLYILFLAPLFGISDDKLGLLILFLIPIWIFIVQQMMQGYFRLLREHVALRSRHEKIMKTHHATEVLSFLHDEKGMSQVLTYMNVRSSITRKLAAAAYLAYDPSLKNLESVRIRVGELISEEGLEGSEDKDAQRQTVKNMEKKGTQEAMDVLQNILLRGQDHALRFMLLQSAGRMKQAQPELKMNRALLQQEAQRELKIYEQIQTVTAFYQKKGVKRQSKLYLQTALQAMADESLERLFHILYLLYPKEEITAIFELLIQREVPEQTRAHALELLTAIVAPPLLFLVQKTLESKRHSSFTSEEIREALGYLASSQDKWFAMFSRYIIHEMNLQEDWPELAVKIPPLQSQAT